MNFLNYIYASKCINCHKENMKLIGGFCQKCYQLMNIKLKFKNDLLYFIDYKDEVNYFIYQAKKHNRPYYIKKFASHCGELLIEHIAKDAVMTYVPLFKKDYLKRGFNQSEIIATQISKRNKVKVTKLLKKITPTKEQKILSKKERNKNVRNAYEYIGKEKYNLVYLVDDIATTKSTLIECKRVLLNHGVKKVIFITLAYVSKT